MTKEEAINQLISHTGNPDCGEAVGFAIRYMQSEMPAQALLDTIMAQQEILSEYRRALGDMYILMEIDKEHKFVEYDLEDCNQIVSVLCNLLNRR